MTATLPPPTNADIQAARVQLLEVVDQLSAGSAADAFIAGAAAALAWVLGEDEGSEEGPT